MTATPASSRVMPSASRDFDTYARERLDGLLRFGYVLTGGQAGAEDLVQETLARMFVVWRRVGDREDVDAYVRRVMLNLHRTWWRRRGRWEQATSTVPEVVAVDVTARRDDFDQLARALTRLPPRQRSAVVLRYYLQLNERETAAAMGCRVGTVKSLSSRGLAQMRMVLGASWDGDAVTIPVRSRTAAPDRPVTEGTCKRISVLSGVATALVVGTALGTVALAGSTGHARTSGPVTSLSAPHSTPTTARPSRTRPAVPNSAPWARINPWLLYRDDWEASPWGRLGADSVYGPDTSQSGSGRCAHGVTASALADSGIRLLPGARITSRVDACLVNGDIWPTVQLDTKAGSSVIIAVRPLAIPNWADRSGRFVELVTGTVLDVDDSDNKIHMTRPDGTLVDISWSPWGASAAEQFARAYDASVPLVRKAAPVSVPPTFWKYLGIGQ